MINRDDCLKKIHGMSKDEFHQKIICGAMKTDAFLSAMALGVSNLPEEDQKDLCDTLAAAGIPITYPTNMHEYTIFKEVFGAITNRAMDVK